MDPDAKLLTTIPHLDPDVFSSMAKAAFVCFPGADYTHRSAVTAARRVLAQRGWTVTEGDAQAFHVGAPDSDQNQDDNQESPKLPVGQSLYLADYDLLPFEDLLPGPRGSSSQCSSYVIRKALIRKHYLASALHSYSVKSPDPARYQSCTPKTWAMEIQFADELDELLMDDLYDLNEILEQNQAIIDGEQEGKPQWFILKPGMADRGNGIRLFATVEELQDIFEEFEPESDDEDDEDDGKRDDRDPEQLTGAGHYPGKDTSVMASQLRHFVVQEYLSNPLLLQPTGTKELADSFKSLSISGPRKFHLRAYVLCCGALSVYLHDDMLALFAPLPYSTPSGETRADLRCHLTNTCLQEDGSLATGDDGRPKEENVFLWSDLAGSSNGLTSEMVETVRSRAARVIGDAFEAAAKAGSIHWQLWPNAFEIFGVDLLVDANLQVKLLEVNAVSSG